jgi:hypothetical protein
MLRRERANLAMNAAIQRRCCGSRLTLVVKRLHILGVFWLVELPEPLIKLAQQLGNPFG